MFYKYIILIFPMYGSQEGKITISKRLFLSITAPFLAAPQKLIIFLYISSFYFGVSFFYFEKISLDLADIGFLAISSAFFSFLLIPSAKPPDVSGLKKWILLFLSCFVVWCAFSVLVNLPRHSYTLGWVSVWFLFNFIQLPVCFYIFSSFALQKYRSFILSCVLFFSCIEIAVALVQYLSNTSSRVTGTFFIHHAMLGNMMVFGALVSLSRLITAKRVQYRIFYAVLFFLSIHTIIISETRSILGGIGIAIIVFLLQFIQFSLKYVITVIVCLVLVFSIFKITPLEDIIRSTIKSQETPIALDMSSFCRLLIWKGSTEYFVESSLYEKLIGCGPGKFSTIIFDFFVYDSKSSSGAHNNYIHVLIESGIIGLILFIIIFFLALYMLHYKSKNDPFSKMLFFGTIAFLGSCLSQETFWVQPVFGNFWILYIVFLGLASGTSHIK